MSKYSIDYVGIGHGVNKRGYFQPCPVHKHRVSLYKGVLYSAYCIGMLAMGLKYAF